MWPLDGPLDFYTSNRWIFEGATRHTCRGASSYCWAVREIIWCIFDCMKNCIVDPAMKKKLYFFADGLGSPSSRPVSMASGDICHHWPSHQNHQDDIDSFTIITIITIHSNQDDIFNANDQEVPARGVACNAHRPTFNSCHLGHRPSRSQGTHHDDLGQTFLSLGGS